MLSSILDQMAAFVEGIIMAFGYPGLALVMFLENVFPPIPSELILPFSGFLVARGEMSFVGVLIASVIGSVAGAVVLYYAGRWAGDPLVRVFLRRWGKWLTVTEAEYDQALRFFSKYGETTIFFGRLVPIIRSIISIPAGAEHMPFGRFLLFTVIGTTLWNALLAGAGMLLGSQWEQVTALVDTYQQVVLVFLVIGAVVGVGWFVWRLVKRRAGVAESVVVADAPAGDPPTDT